EKCKVFLADKWKAIKEDQKERRKKTQQEKKKQQEAEEKDTKETPVAVGQDLDVQYSIEESMKPESSQPKTNDTNTQNVNQEQKEKKKKNKEKKKKQKEAEKKKTKETPVAVGQDLDVQYSNEESMKPESSQPKTNDTNTQNLKQEQKTSETDEQVDEMPAINALTDSENDKYELPSPSLLTNPVQQSQAKEKSQIQKTVKVLEQT